jgi:hypothetical protein
MQKSFDFLRILKHISTCFKTQIIDFEADVWLRVQKQSYEIGYFLK